MRNLKNFCPKTQQKLIDPFLESLKFTRQFSDNTCKSYLLDIKQYYSFLTSSKPSLTIQEVDIHHAELYLEYLYRASLTRKSMARKLSALRLFYEYLVLNKKVGKNPFKGIKIKGLDSNLPKTIPEQTLKIFLDQLKGDSFLTARQHFCVECLYGTGLRVSELISINFQDIQTDDTCVIKGKGSKERMIWFSPTVKKSLESYLHFRSEIKLEDQEALLVSKKGKRLSVRQVQREFKDLRNMYQLPEWFSPHSLRHAFASSVLNHGAPLAVVKKLLGHESIQSTSVYTHINLEGLKKKMNKLL